MKKVYLIATIMALITGISVYFFITNLKKSTSEANTPTTPVVVATSDIAENTVITAKMVEVKQLPSSAVTAGTARTAEEIVGKIAKYPVSAGEQIVTQRLKTAGSDDGTDLSYQLKGDERAITISVDEVTGVSGFIKSGDTVDIITTTTVNTVPVTSYLLQNIKVLKISDKAANSTGQQITQYTTVTLCLSPDDCLKLGNALDLKKSIRLVLHSIAETTQATAGTTQTTAASAS